MNVANLKQMVSTLEKVIASNGKFDMTIYLDTLGRCDYKSLQEEVEAGTTGCACGWYRIDNPTVFDALSRHFGISAGIFDGVFGTNTTEYGKPPGEVTPQDVIDKINKLIGEQT